MIQMLELTKDFKIVIITVFHEAKENTFKINRRQAFSPEKWKLFYKETKTKEF